MLIQEDYFKNIFNTVREAILILDENMRVLSANRSFFHIFKVDTANTIGSLLYDLGNGQWNIPYLRVLLEDILPKNDTVDDYEIEHNFESIGHKTMLLNACKIREKKNDLPIILLAIEDITERKRLEDLLTESEFRYRRIFETASDGIVLLEKSEGKIIHANPAAEKMLGYSEEESLGKKLQDIGVWLDMSDFPAIMQALDKSGIINYADVQVKTKSGQYIDTDIYIVDRANLAQCNIRDVTERRQKEEDLRKLNRTLLARSKSSKAMMSARDEIWYLNEVCRIIVEDCGHALVWIGFAEQDEDRSVRPVAYAGFEEGYLDTANITWSDTKRGHGPVGTAIRTGKPSIFRNILGSPAFAPWREEAVKRGYAAIIGVPLLAEGKAFGSLNIYSRYKDPFSDEEVQLLNDLAADLSYGIAAIRQHIAQAEAESALRESEAQYRHLFDNMLEGYAYCRMLYIDDTPQDFVYIYVNKAFESLTGLKNVIGKKVSEVIPGIQESNPELLRIYGRVALTGKPEQFESYVESLGIWFSIAAYSTEKDHFVAVFDNITERKRTEEALRHSHERLRRFVDANIVGIIIARPSGGVIEANDYYLRLIGYTREEFEQGLVDWRAITPSEWLPADEHAIRELRERGTCTPYEKEYVRRDGTRVSVFLSDAMLPGPEEHIAAFILDITDRKHLEAQLRHSQKMEAVGALAGGIAHDFNNILNVIMGYGSMVLDKLEADSPEKGQMNEILAAAEKAAILTKRLLVFSRKQLTDVKPTNLNELITDIQKMLVRIISESIDFKLDLSDRRLAVMADAGQIEQVLLNLAANARDAMPEGGRLTISTGLQEIDDEYIALNGYGTPGMYVIITVSDTGRGIDAETQKKIFEPFFTTKGIGEGTGLGLAISYGIIKQHNGYIKVYSEPGQGTVFKIYLPLLEEAASLKKKTETTVHIRGGNETILVAEDDASLRDLTRIVLESFGYSVITAEDGEDAVAKFMENRERIVLAILDMIMPKKNGKEVSEALRGTNPRVKILFVSGYTMDIIKNKELTESGSDFIQKPIRPQDLLIKVREVLDK